MKNRIGLLGGTFDPPHCAHLELASAARRQLNLDSVIFIPAGNPWRKDRVDLTSAELRYAMVQEAISELSWATVSRIEVDRVGPTYTFETLEALQAGQPEAVFWFVIGADSLADMSNWVQPERIIAKARLAIADREGAGIDPDDRLLKLIPNIREKLDFVQMEALATTSTNLRARLQSGVNPLEEVDLSGPVAEFIKRNGVYSSS
ncbi:MAG TPA: nicotinate (nicotinamide) nucleotide adenylyltransferase [Dehalococcoidia bacterium]|nr:nicotinate (nicotinamide) nucleotide adenylyltransferase [Dehalococcoidia bacterium]